MTEIHSFKDLTSLVNKRPIKCNWAKYATVYDFSDKNITNASYKYLEAYGKLVRIKEEGEIIGE